MLSPSAETSRLQISSPATVGRTNPVWGHFGMKAPEFPMDQRLETMPEDAEQHPVPAILEYIPYCKRDRTSERDEDMPFSLCFDCAIPAGMPVAMHSRHTHVYNRTRIRADCIHIAGGCLLLENPNWAFNMFGRNARPPDPLLFGEGWSDLWMQRIENNVPWIIEWLKHQRRDDFWKHASVCEDYFHRLSSFCSGWMGRCIHQSGTSTDGEFDSSEKSFDWTLGA